MTAVAFAHTVDTVDTVDVGAKNRANPKPKLPGYIGKYVTAYRRRRAFCADPVHPVHSVHRGLPLSDEIQQLRIAEHKQSDTPKWPFRLCQTIRENSDMTVGTDTTHPALAASGQSTDTLAGDDPSEHYNGAQQTTGGHDGTRYSPQSEARMPSRDRLAWLCDRCERRIVGTGAGFAAIDLRDTDAAAKGLLRREGVAVKARWRVFHATCAPECVKPLNPFFRIWLDRVTSVDDLLDAVAELS
jgi:hypothetical protein